MKIIGVTESGKHVVGDLFLYFDTIGLPLADIFSICIKNDFQPCWISFYKEALEHGWKHKTIMVRLHDAITDSYDKEYASIVINRLNSYFPQ